MTTRYTDTEHLIESLRLVTGDLTDETEGRLTVLDSGQAVVCAETHEEIGERNLWGTEIAYVDDHICTIAWDVNEADGHTFRSYRLHFHEKVVEEPFELRPQGPHVVASSESQATNPLALGPRLKAALSPLVEEADAMFTFAGVTAASAAHGGHFCDFEFEYAIDGVAL